MSTNIDLQDIHTALTISGTTGFTGKFEALGGGEINDAYRLDCGDRQIILRVAKYEDQHTLQSEARALNLLNSPHIPKLIYFNGKSRIKGRLWILESYITGVGSSRLTIKQFTNLGVLLARVHRVSFNKKAKVNLRRQFVDICKMFGTESQLLDHPDPALKSLIQKAYEEFKQQQPLYDLITPALIHPDEKAALFNGYESGGGKIDEKRIKFWINFDKLGAAVFLYWRLNESTRDATPAQIGQYRVDFDNLVASLSS